MEIRGVNASAVIEDERAASEDVVADVGDGSSCGGNHKHPSRSGDIDAAVSPAGSVPGGSGHCIGSKRSANARALAHFHGAGRLRRTIIEALDPVP
jgi:hypothetical protein